ncbi:ATP-dependent Clp protease proteolytic subunit 1 [Bacteroidales bacterium Barb6]|nr:ATP-dependent Clp protease proteolytic subunit 1 [Bacteroidales bacterium Barb4]OAV67062.1 ATP-dependent Clp protease proteolytic subunit 1 [Bacteroidales bacterium Barb6]OAV76235.1 ATP-dependent Clp protease proteolytic subunit 1 [Bacteroidales bacterium Barb7]
MELGKIEIRNEASGEAVIDIEGIIGLPEWWQFEDDDTRVSTWAGFKSALDKIKSISAQKVTVNIRSLGGDTNHALAIHDELKQLNSEVTTNCYGYVASAATIIAQAASKGNRKISSNVLYLVHQAWTYSAGNIADFQNTIQLLEKTNDVVSALYASASGREKESFAELMGRQNGNGEWLTAQEAIDNGLADTTVDFAGTSSMDASLMSKFRYPEIPKGKAIEVQSPNTVIVTKDEEESRQEEERKRLADEVAEKERLEAEQKSKAEAEAKIQAETILRENELLNMNINATIVLSKL